MQRDRQAEGEHVLRLAESELQQSLLDVLPRVVDTGVSIFTNTHFNPHKMADAKLVPSANALLNTALACLEIRKALGFDSAASVGQLFINACSENASQHAQRRSPQKLAAALLQTLRPLH